MKRAPGLYWVQLQRMPGVPTIARWTGFIWIPPIGVHFVPRQPELRVRKVLSGRLTPPSKDWLPSPPERVLLDSGKGYREELTVDRVNHATGAVYVSRRAQAMSVLCPCGKTARKGHQCAVTRLRAELEQANGLWRNWTTHDITENDDEWAAFSNAVRDHLDGKPVPERFVRSKP